MKEKLVVTNYDNFKNADFFINQYFQAEQMMKEVNDFFGSFYMSKLLTAKDLINYHPNSFGADGAYKSIAWTNKIVGWYTCDKCHDYMLSKNYDKKSWNTTDEEIEKTAKEVKEKTYECIQKIFNMMNNEYDCYYVLDENNNLCEFIPVSAKDSIKVNFKNKKSDNIIIEGYFYEYYEFGAQWGNCEYTLDKIIRKIYINRYTNNVVKVESDIKEISRGKVGGKDYWSKDKLNYCSNVLDGNVLRTDSFDKCEELLNNDIYNKLNEWEYNYKYHQEKNNTKENIDQFKDSLLKKYFDRYKKSYNQELTIDIINKKFDYYTEKYCKFDT